MTSPRLDETRIRLEVLMRIAALVVWDPKGWGWLVELCLGTIGCGSQREAPSWDPQPPHIPTRGGFTCSPAWFLLREPGCGRATSGILSPPRDGEALGCRHGRGCSFVRDTGPGSVGGVGNLSFISP